MFTYMYVCVNKYIYVCYLYVCIYIYTNPQSAATMHVLISGSFYNWSRNIVWKMHFQTEAFATCIFLYQTRRPSAFIVSAMYGVENQRVIILSTCIDENTLLLQPFTCANKWSCWRLKPGPSVCEVNVIPLHHKPVLTCAWPVRSIFF